MVDLVQKIAQVDELEVDDVLNAVRQRYTGLFPDWELILISLQKSADKNEQLDKIIGLLQNMEASS